MTGRWVDKCEKVGGWKWEGGRLKVRRWQIINHSEEHSQLRQGFLKKITPPHFLLCWKQEASILSDTESYISPQKSPPLWVSFVKSNWHFCQYGPAYGRAVLIAVSDLVHTCRHFLHECKSVNWYWPVKNGIATHMSEVLTLVWYTTIIGQKLT